MGFRLPRASPRGLPSSPSRSRSPTTRPPRQPDGRRCPLISPVQRGTKDAAEKLLAGHVMRRLRQLGGRRSVLLCLNSPPAEAIVGIQRGRRAQLDRHVLARAAWTWPDVAGKPDCGSACPRPRARPRRPLKING